MKESNVLEEMGGSGKENRTVYQPYTPTCFKRRLISHEVEKARAVA